MFSKVSLRSFSHTRKRNKRVKEREKKKGRKKERRKDGLGNPTVGQDLTISGCQNPCSLLILFSSSWLSFPLFLSSLLPLVLSPSHTFMIRRKTVKTTITIIIRRSSVLLSFLPALGKECLTMNGRKRRTFLRPLSLPERSTLKQTATTIYYVLSPTATFASTLLKDLQRDGRKKSCEGRERENEEEEKRNRDERNRGRGREGQELVLKEQ